MNRKISTFMAGLAVLCCLGAGESSGGIRSTFVGDVASPQEGWAPGKGSEVVWNLEPQEFEPHRRPWAVRWGLEIIEQQWAKVPGRTPESESFTLKSIDVRFRAQPYIARGERARWETEAMGAVRQLQIDARKSFDEAIADLSRIGVTDVEWGKKKAEARIVALEQRLRAEWQRSSRLTREGTAELPVASSRNLASTQRAALVEDGALVNIPTQRWNGEPVVRASLLFSAVTDKPAISVTGLFLLDPNAERSLISPEFLDRHGVLVPVNVAPWLENESIRFRGREISAQPIVPQNLRVSGIDIAGVKRLWLFPTQVFAPPTTRLPCCDGVLGRDFFTQYRVGFRLPERGPRDLARTTLWSRASSRFTELPAGWKAASLHWAPSVNQWAIGVQKLDSVEFWKESSLLDLPHGWMATAGKGRVPASGSVFAKAIWRWREAVVAAVTSKGETHLREERVLELNEEGHRGSENFRAVESIQSWSAEDLDDSDVSELLSGRFGVPEIRYTRGNNRSTRKSSPSIRPSP